MRYIKLTYQSMTAASSYSNTMEFSGILLQLHEISTHSVGKFSIENKLPNTFT